MIAGNSELPGAIFSPVFAEAPRLEWVHASQSDAGVLVTHNATVHRLFGADVRVNTRNLRVRRRNRGNTADDTHPPTSVLKMHTCALREICHGLLRCIDYRGEREQYFRKNTQKESPLFHESRTNETFI